MLPLHRLAGDRQQSQGLLSRGTVYFRTVWASRLATRVLILLTAFVFILLLLSPSSYDIRHSLEFDNERPPPGHEGGHHGLPPMPPPDHPHAPPPPPADIDPAAAALWAQRAEQVKASFVHAWDGYEQYAFGHDELQPESNSSIINLNGWGVTIVDSLSTMQLMGLTDIYDRSMVHVRKMHFKDYQGTIPFFETVIRYLGGLLSAYAFTKDPVLLRLSDELGETLLPVFSSKSGLPSFGYDPSRGATSVGWTGASLLAEIGSCQMEYKYLAHITGKSEYFKKVDKVMDILEREQWTAKGYTGNAGNGRNEGLWAVRWDVTTGKGLGDSATVGAWADSAYEYLLKGYLMSGRSEKRLLKMYLKSVKGVLDNLMYLSGTRNMLYVTDISGGTAQPGYKLEHLSCFYGGLLALGVETLAPTEMSHEDAQLHRWAAEGLTTTCYLTYAESVSGLGPEEAHFFNTKEHPNKLWMPEVEKWKRNGKPGGVPPGVLRGDDAAPRKMKEPATTPNGATSINDYWHASNGYLSRPETVESVYIMWKVTKDPIWRQRGWEIYQAIEKHCRMPAGYGSVFNVGLEHPVHTNSMPSYFLAETLKYLWLLFAEHDPISFDKWMFNTEAHPLPVFHWTEREKLNYGIQ